MCGDSVTSHYCSLGFREEPMLRSMRVNPRTKHHELKICLCGCFVREPLSLQSTDGSVVPTGEDIHINEMKLMYYRLSKGIYWMQNWGKKRQETHSQVQERLKQEPWKSLPAKPVVGTNAQHRPYPRPHPCLEGLSGELGVQKYKGSSSQSQNNNDLSRDRFRSPGRSASRCCDRNRERDHKVRDRGQHRSGRNQNKVSSLESVWSGSTLLELYQSRVDQVDTFVGCYSYMNSDQSSLHSETTVSHGEIHTVCLGSTNIFFYFHVLRLVWHVIKRYGWELYTVRRWVSNSQCWWSYGTLNF